MALSRFRYKNLHDQSRKGNYLLCSINKGLCDTAHKGRQPHSTDEKIPMQIKPYKPEIKELPFLRVIKKPKQLTSVDILKNISDNIKEARTNDEILYLISIYHKTVTSDQVVSGLKLIYKNLKLDTKTREREIESLRHDTRFKLLTVLAAKLSPNMSTVELYDVIKITRYLGFNSSDNIMRVYLQLIKYHINDMKLSYSAQFAYILSNMEQTEQITLLLDMLELSIKLQLESNVSELSSSRLIHILNVYGASLDSDQISLIVTHLIDRIGTDNHFPCIILLEVLEKHSIKNNILLKFCLTKIRHQIQRKFLDFDQVLKTLKYCGSLDHYTSETFELIMHFYLDQSLDFNQLTKVLNYFVDCRFYPGKLVNRFLDKRDIADFGAVQDFETLKTLLRPCAVFNMDISDYLLEKISFPDNIRIDEILEYNKYTIPLGLPARDIDERSLLKYGDEIISSDITFDEKRQKLMDLSVHLINYDKRISIDTSLLKNEHELSFWLTSAVFDEFEIKESQYSHGVYFDYILSRIPHSTNKLKGKPNKVCLILCDQKLFIENLRQPQGQYEYIVKTLKSKGISTILVNTRFWNQIPEKERLDFLHRTILHAEDGNSYQHIT